ncbi:hypothetical protein [Bacteroidetes bacterium endosymbiont of Geopemphigus sp.]|uniref:hypothetical protein n=1 Tax=Bacteroidetes bacterium endosymbiont of Geopemphigus sp. TaxID=2047937 RepID=UPI000CD0E983|nr:hypothetical protein [Bacteroidetes bacterium endosymbiont of Geopemphigus sp.]
MLIESDIQEIKAYLSSCTQKHPRARGISTTLIDWRTRIHELWIFKRSKTLLSAAESPIFQKIVSKELYNTLLIIVRYF